MKLIIISALLVLGACSGQSTKKDSKEEKSKVSSKKEEAHSSKVANPNFEFKSVESQTNCKSLSDERVITHGLIDGGGCAVNYTKFGQKGQVAKAKYNYNHCSNTFDKIKARLEKAGFTCE